MALPNPNRPLLSVDADFTVQPPAKPGANAMSLSSRGATVTELSVRRGRQNELGRAESGTASLLVHDPLELLNPANTASAFNSGANSIQPYRGLWIYALWPLTGNINNPSSVNSAFDPSFEAGVGGWTTGDANGSLASSATQFWHGTKSLRVQLTGPSSSCQLLVPTNPGIDYTVSAYVMRDTTSTGTSITLGAISAGGPRSVASTATTWTRLAVSFQATDAWTPITLYLDGGPTGPGAQLAWLDAVQLEFGSAASAFTTTGPAVRWMHTGWIERYAQGWQDAGTTGMRQLESVDALSQLSRITINQSYQSTILADSPYVYIPYNDKSGPQVVQLPQGGQPVLGYTSLGTSGAVNFAGDTFLDGSSAVTVVQQNSNPPTKGNTSYITYLGTQNGTLVMNPQSFTIEVWARVTAGEPYFAAGMVQSGENLNTAPFGAQYNIGWYTFQGGKLGWVYRDPNGAGTSGGCPGNYGFPDGQWHYFAVKCVGSNGITAVTDNVIGGVATITPAPSQAIVLNNLYVDSQAYWGDPITSMSVAHMACYPYALSNAQLAAHYNRGSGYVGELSGTRANRLLTQYWSSNILTATGRSAMSADHYYNGKSLLGALQDIADTEDGLLWVDGSGTVRFDSRETRYLNSPTSAYTFGEKTSAGELPYTDLKYDFDPNKTYSGASITNAAGTVFTAGSGPRIFSKTMYLANNWDAQQAANSYAGRYATARMRIPTLKIDPASNPALWPAALSLDVGSRITVNRRTAAGVTMNGDYYIEQLQHDIRADRGTWTVTYQLSPVYNPVAGKLGDATYGVLGSTTVCVY